MSDPIRIGIAGALGRMGQAVARLVEASDDAVIAARFDRPGVHGEGLVDQAQALELAEVIIDFTTPSSSMALAMACAERGGPALVIGTTGLADADIETIAQAATRVAIVRSGNFSLGVNLLIGLVAQAARALPADAYDIEIFEAHHRRKVDAPSGTALMLGEAAARGRGVTLADVERRARDGLAGPRPAGEIGFSVLRGGDIIGEHSVTFAADEELLTISHSARDRSLFARGAVTAARWVAGRNAGEFDMQDVLDLK